MPAPQYHGLSESVSAIPLPYFFAVPVVEVQRSSFYPGGAANVARNLCSFLKQPSVAGVIGKDEAGGLRFVLQVLAGQLAQLGALAGRLLLAEVLQH